MKLKYDHSLNIGVINEKAAVLDTKDWTSCKARNTRQLSVVESNLGKVIPERDRKVLTNYIAFRRQAKSFSCYGA